MSTIATSSGWMTSFIYEQDLTSYYMNNILTGILHPGVYNANIALVNDGNGIYLSIKKGTTFLFSNSYYQKNGRYYRNFKGIDETYNSNNNRNSAVMIKCVAQQDFNHRLIDLSLDSFTSANRPDTMYVFSYFKYESKPHNASAEVFSIPGFVLVEPNNKSSNNNLNDTENYLYKTLFPVYKVASDVDVDSSFSSTNESSVYFVPDGCRDYSLASTSRSLYDYSFLNLGAIVERGGDNKTAIEPSDWIKMHAFTAHGLPEYRYPIVSETNTMQPDIILDMYGWTDGKLCNKVYIDMPDTMYEDALLNNTINNDEDLGWLQCYKNEVRIGSLLPNIDDLKVATGITTETLVVDAIYGTYKSEIVEPDSLGSTPSLYGNNSALRFNSHQFSIPYKDDFKIDYLNYSPNWWRSTTYSGMKVLPLDICKMNIDRLLPLVRNQDIWPKIIYSLRREDKVSSSDSTSIIPIALAFRYFNVNENGDIYSFDSFTSMDSINPVNMISYFDLAKRMSKVNVLNVGHTNVSNLVPIL